MSSNTNNNKLSEPIVVKSDSEWREQLTNEQYRVARLAGTERPFSHPFYNSKGSGDYMCVCCDAKLFTSNHKFDAGCGWPSFDRALDTVLYVEDNTLGMKRVEVLCKNCHAHLGHVFDDGPTETRKRYCINGVCLLFKPQE